MNVNAVSGIDWASHLRKSLTNLYLLGLQAKGTLYGNEFPRNTLQRSAGRQISAAL